MASATTRFLPERDGFKFTNSFRVEIKQEIPLIGEIGLEDVTVGLCGGMCFTALDYFHSNKEIPPIETVSGVSSELRGRLIRKQIQSIFPPDGVLKVLTWTAINDTYVWRHTAGREFGKVRTRLNKKEPVVLALIRAGRGEDIIENHQVVAHSYNYNEQSGRVRIGIYDPNHPGERSQLSLNIASPRTGINAKQSNDVPFRGFFVIDYKPEKIKAEN